MILKGLLYQITLNKTVIERLDSENYLQIIIKCDLFDMKTKLDLN